MALAIGAVAALITGDGAKGLSFTSFALHAAYLAPWFDVPWIVPVFWSLAIEFQFYVIMMLAAPLLITNNKNGILIFYGLCGLASLVSTDMRLLCAYIPLFAIGFAQFSIASGMLTRLEGAVVAIAFAAVGWHTLPDHNHVVAALATFAFMFWRPSRPLPFISWVGKISYSLYLVHIPVGGKVIVYAASFTPHVVLQHVAVAVALTLSIAVAWLFWFVIEVGLSAQIARWWPEFVGRAPGVLGVVQPSPSRQ